MPKNGKKQVGENPKAAAARDRKADAKAVKDHQEKSRAEDQYWAEAGAGAKSKAQAKKDDQGKQREEAAAKKAEAKKLAAEEAASLASSSGAAAKKAAGPKKVTSHQLNLQREAQQRQLEAAAKEKDKEQRREVDEDAYAESLAGPNTNHEDYGDTATNVDDALSVLSLDSEKEDRHPERRVKAGHAAFAERELPQLKEDKPGLKQSQYQEMIWKMWAKSPENPLNRQNWS